ncbi:hypothetical protein GCM10025872_17490 [Barrientosiimonas endolithica]|nr:hypothetical protein GCM10025872_17490 [Barrientosiimonas endolithica]
MFLSLGTGVHRDNIAGPDSIPAPPRIVPVTDATEPETDFARVPDGFQRLWTPHRMAYIQGEKPADEPGEGCPFCAAPHKSDAEGLIVHRGETCYVVLNLFPYNPGHALICPYRHEPAYVGLTDEETLEFTALTKATVRALQRASAPMGFNLGMNQGRSPEPGWPRTCTSTSCRAGEATPTSSRSSARPRPCRCCWKTRDRPWSRRGRPEPRGQYAERTMLNRFARALFTKLFTPLARLFLRLGISPDVVTLVGTLGVSLGALAFYPRGEFFLGTLIITLFVFSDTIDGVMARMSGRSSKWGAYLDSTLDRVGDAAIFGALVMYYAGDGANTLMAALALACLILGSVVSYAKARAEGLGMTANVGIAERADRLVAVLVTTGLVGLGLPEVVLTVVLALLAVASLVTVLQRILTVRRQALGPAATPES